MRLLLLFALMADLPDIRTIQPDLITPPMTEGEPAPGRRVRQTLPQWSGTAVHHALYLPTNWILNKRYPVIVEYAGNGDYRNQYGDASDGVVEGSNLGYGISGGKDFIWISMPFVDAEKKENASRWWGDVPATIAYCRNAVRMVCERYGGDPSEVFLTGFSRGAIACNYIGLHNDEIADIWLAFLPYSHYDGSRPWPGPDADRASAILRLPRLKGRATFVTHEKSVEPTREYLESVGLQAPFVFRTVPFRNHNDAWTLRDIPLRRELRAWAAEVRKKKPGLYEISGRVRDAAGKPAAGIRVESGFTHFTETGADGRYRLPGLVAGERNVTVNGASRRVRLDRNVPGIDFTIASR